MHDVPGRWTAGIMARAEGLKFESGGYLRMVVEVYHAHPGVSRHSVENPPDETVVIDIPGGDYALSLIHIYTISNKLTNTGLW